MVLNLKLLAALSAMRTVPNKTVKEAPFHVAFGFESQTPRDTVRNNMIGKSLGDKKRRNVSSFDESKEYPLEILFTHSMETGRQKTARKKT